MKFKLRERVELIHYQDFGKIVKLYPQEKKYQIIPDGSDQHWILHESEIRALKK